MTQPSPHPRNGNQDDEDPEDVSPIIDQVAHEEASILVRINKLEEFLTAWRKEWGAFRGYVVGAIGTITTDYLKLKSDTEAGMAHATNPAAREELKSFTSEVAEKVEQKLGIVATHDLAIAEIRSSNAEQISLLKAEIAQHEAERKRSEAETKSALALRTWVTTTAVTVGTIVAGLLWKWWATSGH